MKIDIWENCQYKPNHIYNADCYEAIKKIPSKSIDLVYIDIPYLIEDGGCSSSELSKRIKKVQHQEIENIRHSINYSIFDELCRVMKKIYIYIWCSKEQMFEIMKYFIENKKVRFNLLVWCKTNPTPMTNNVWLPDVEYCFCFKERGAKRYNDGYELKSKFYLSAKNKQDKNLFQHPTIKPLELVKRHLLHSTNENDIVLDCFLGSGTTAVACKELGRKYIGFEIDKTYYNIAKERLNGVTQKDKEEQIKGQTNIFDYI